MMQGPIHRLALDRVLRRDDVRLPSVWVEGAPPRGALAGLSWLSTMTPEPARAGGDSPALIMLRSDEGAVMEELAEYARGGVRVYVLVPPAWGQGPLPSPLQQAPRVLFRRVPEVPVAGVHTGSGARLWLGGAWSLRLDTAQGDAFRQTFLRLFWHDATEEAWSGGRQLSWRAAGERPFDVPELSRRAPVRLVPPDAHLELGARGALVHVASGPPPEATPRRLWFPASADHHARLARLVHDGAEVLWEDRGLPDLLVGGNGGEVLLPGTRSRLRVLLTPDQATDASRVLEAPAPWRFRIDLRVGDAAAEAVTCWLPGEAMAHGVEPEQDIALPDVQATTLRAMPQTSPAASPDPQPLALSARLRWTVLPPRLPAGAGEDALVGRWRRTDQDWASRLGRLRATLEAAEGHRGRIRSAFTRLASAMLGYERTHHDMQAQVASMEDQLPSVAGPAGAPALLSTLGQLEEQAQRLQDDMEEAERRAREDEDREKQRAEWRARVDTASRDLATRRTALADAAAREPALTEELLSVEEAQKKADGQLRKDLGARRRQLSDERVRTNKEIKRLRGEVGDLEQRAAEPFEFRPLPHPTPRPSRPGGRFVPAAADSHPSPPIPEEALPEVGALRTHKGQRYLVIQTWDELTAGERAASRLSARLVAPEDA